MGEPRTENQRIADQFDMRLYRLINDAQQLAAPSGERRKWAAVSERLSHARLAVREMMHADDRKETA